MNYLILLIPITLVIINMPLLKYRIYNKGNGNYIMNIPRSNNCRLTPLRGDTCIKQNVNNCPMSSYKQCTNNVFPINKCSCNERSFELCPIHNQYGEKCALQNFPIKKRDSTINYPSHYPRVNMYRSQETKYDHI